MYVMTHVRYSHGFFVFCCRWVISYSNWIYLPKFRRIVLLKFYNYFLTENKFKNEICKVVSILSRLQFVLTHLGRVMHICISKLTIICSDNGLLSSQCQAIISTNAGISLIWPLETQLNKILVIFIKKNCTWKYCMGNVSHVISLSMC